MRFRFVWQQAIGRITEKVKQKPLPYSVIGGTVGAALVFSLYKGYAAVFEYRHNYLEEAISRARLNSQLLELIGKPANIQIIHSGTVDSVAGFARSKLEASGEKGVAIIHLNARIKTPKQNENSSQFDAVLNTEHVFSNLWEYPYVLKWYVIAAIKRIALFGNENGFNLGNADAPDTPIQSNLAFLPQEWDINNGFVVFYPRGYSSFSNAVSRICHYLGFSQDFHGSDIRIFPLWGNIEENPEFYKYIRKSKWVDHQRATKYFPIICSGFCLSLVLIGGVSIFKYLYKPAVTELIELFAYAHPEILSRLRRPAIQEVIGTKASRFMDVEVVLLGTDGNSADLRITASRGTANDPFKIARSDLFFQAKWIKLDVQKIPGHRLICK